MKNLHECKKVVYVRLRKDAGFKETGNYGFCTINKNSMDALQPCCEILCPLGLKVGSVKKDLIETYDCGHSVKEVVINTNACTLALYADWKESKSGLCIECWINKNTGVIEGMSNDLKSNIDKLFTEPHYREE